MNDPTRIREQPSLTSSHGRSWLIVGGLFTVIALGVLIPEAVLDLAPHGIPLAAGIVVVVLYGAMVVTRFAVPRGRRRLGMLAIGMLAIALVSLVAVAVVATATGNSTPV